ncbi:hypothetical protein K461DRAFT_310592 [Myriangium duriaei CBS 260.36]|uniref:BTB domain-containing protein n=1 Tax=Myriangium duriaei CBS 260.36 TaxID=1168546 RepID=A0A9P4MIJ5_9PEZI|nr:hypothetical protein K461DRAFT_310592 [Myriangium duriaei CBS 260.36]
MPSIRSRNRGATMSSMNSNTSSTSSASSQSLSSDSSGPDYTGEVVLILAGPSSLGFPVHKSILIADCSFARGALRWEMFQSSQILTLKLPHTSPVTVDTYVKWLYDHTVYTSSQFMPTPSTSPGSGIEGGAVMHQDMSTSRGEDAKWTLLIDAYLLGDYIQSIGFQNAVAEAMCKKWRVERRWPLGYASKVYKETTPGSKLRQMIVDFHVYLGKGEMLPTVDAMDVDAGAEFMVDVVKAFHDGGAGVWSDAEANFWDEGSTRYLLEDNGLGVECSMLVIASE